MFTVSYLMFKYRADGDVPSDPEEDIYIEDEDEDEQEALAGSPGLGPLRQSSTVHTDNGGASIHNRVAKGVHTAHSQSAMDAVLKTQIDLQNAVKERSQRTNAVERGGNITEIVATTTSKGAAVQIRIDDALNGGNPTDLPLEDEALTVNEDHAQWLDEEKKYGDPLDVEVAEHSAVQWSNASLVMRWSAQGVCTRFTADHLYKVWPHYFVRDDQLSLCQGEVLYRHTLHIIAVTLHSSLESDMFLHPGRREDVQNFLLVDCNVTVWFLSLVYPQGFNGSCACNQWC